MRIAILIAVVVAHIALVWYFVALRHIATSADTDTSSMTLVFLSPAVPIAKAEASDESVESASSAASRDSWQAPLSYHNAPGALKQAIPAPEAAAHVELPQTAEVPSSTPNAPTSPAPDWHTEAEIVAQTNAQHIVESEDKTARQAGALAAIIKPLPGPYVPGPSFHWDPNPRYRWKPAPGGGFVMPLNDHCQIFVLIVVWAGCSIGGPSQARGDLFKNMHPPMKYGDWDWRLADP